MSKRTKLTSISSVKDNKLKINKTKKEKIEIDDELDQYGIPNKLNKLFDELGIILFTDKCNGRRCISITDKQKDQIPFDILSDRFKISSMSKITDTNKIVVNEMIDTMMKKKKIKTTTKSNIHMLIKFFEVLCRDKTNEKYEVYNDNGLFRSEDKFTFRLVENLKIIFPGIEDRIMTQRLIHSVRKYFILDICIDIS